MSDLIAVMVQCVIEKPVTPDSTESEGEGEEPPTKKIKGLPPTTFPLRCVLMCICPIYMHGKAWGGKHVCASVYAFAFVHMYSCVCVCVCVCVMN